MGFPPVDHVGGFIAVSVAELRFKDDSCHHLVPKPPCNRLVKGSDAPLPSGTVVVDSVPTYSRRSSYANTYGNVYSMIFPARADFCVACCGASARHIVSSLSACARLDHPGGGNALNRGMYIEPHRHRDVGRFQHLRRGVARCGNIGAPSSSLWWPQYPRPPRSPCSTVSRNRNRGPCVRLPGTLDEGLLNRRSWVWCSSPLGVIFSCLGHQNDSGPNHLLLRPRRHFPVHPVLPAHVPAHLAEAKDVYGSILGGIMLAT